MQKISYQQLRDMRSRDEDTALINVLAPEHFKKAHIPGSVNVPYDRPDFASQVESLIGGKDKPVIVYCASLQCDASKKAAEKLEKASFTRVMCYEGGTQEWQEKSASRQAA